MPKNMYGRSTAAPQLARSQKLVSFLFSFLFR
jgi:hypothetical protein